MAKLYIGLPVYNGQSFLNESLESLAAQTFTNFTVLISDNASSDGTEEIGRAWAAKDPRFIYYKHPKNLGAAANFNYCLKDAEGAYFKWMAHDDLCAPDYLRVCIDLLDRDPGAVLAHTQVTKIDPQGQITGTYDREHDLNHDDPVVRFTRAMATDHACVSVFGVIRLNVLKQTPAIAPFVGSDRPLLAELAMRGRFEYVAQPLFLWRDHPDRSVRKTRKERLAWFDARATGVGPTLYVRQFIANLRVALTVPKRIGQRGRGFVATLRWCLANWRFLRRDLRAVIGYSLERLSLRKRST